MGERIFASLYCMGHQPAAKRDGSMQVASTLALAQTRPEMALLSAGDLVLSPIATVITCAIIISVSYRRAYPHSCTSLHSFRACALTTQWAASRLPWGRCWR